MKAKIAPTLICPECNAILSFVDGELREYMCGFSSCKNFMKILKIKNPPTVELELVDD